MNVLEQQRALLPKEYRDKFVYCPVTDEERAVRHMAERMYKAKEYLKRPLRATKQGLADDLAEIERIEQKCHEAYMSLSPKIRGGEILTGNKLLEVLMREIEKPTEVRTNP